MADANLVREVAEAVGAGLMDDRVAGALAEKLIEVRLSSFFRPIVRAVLAETLGLDPEDIGPELVDEGLSYSITAVWVAKTWLAERIDHVIAELREQFSEYEFDDSDNTKQVAKNYLVTRDADSIVAIAVRDNLLRRKA